MDLAYRILWTQYRAVNHLPDIFIAWKYLADYKGSSISSLAATVFQSSTWTKHHWLELHCNESLLMTSNKVSFNVIENA